MVPAHHPGAWPPPIKPPDYVWLVKLALVVVAGWAVRTLDHRLFEAQIRQDVIARQTAAAVAVQPVTNRLAFDVLAAGTTVDVQVWIDDGPVLQTLAACRSKLAGYGSVCVLEVQGTVGEHKVAVAYAMPGGHGWSPVATVVTRFHR